MPLRVEISDDDIQYLNEPAKEELKRCLMGHSTEILEEANRLDAALRTTSGNPELTSSMVIDASILVGRRYINPKKPKWLTIVKIGATISSAITGFLIESINEPWGPYVFAVSFAVACTLTVIAIMKE